MRRLVATAAALSLVALGGCGGDDDTTTVTTTQTDTGAAATPPEQTTTVTAEGQVCSSKSAPNVTDLSVVNMTCEEADALTGDVIQSLSRQPFTVGDFECEIHGRSGPDSGPILGAEDIRCESGDRAFSFTFGD